MNLDWLRELCLSFPHTTEQVQWDDDLLFKIGGKMFAVAALEPGGNWLSFKASPENFVELTERIGVIPAPYLARAQWVALETQDALPPDELASLLRASYDLIFARLPRKSRESLRQVTPQPSTKKKSPQKTPRQKQTRKRTHKSRARGR